MRQLAGRAAIGHVRYATCGKDDRNTHSRLNENTFTNANGLALL